MAFNLSDEENSNFEIKVYLKYIDYICANSFHLHILDMFEIKDRNRHEKPMTRQIYYDVFIIPEQDTYEAIT